MKKFAVFDIDGTLIRWQLYHALVDRLAKQDLLGPSAHKRLHEARMHWKKREHSEAFKEYEKELIEVYDNALRTISTEVFDEAVKNIASEYKQQVYTYTRDLIARLKKEDYMLLAISGSQQEIVSQIAELYGFDDCIGAAYVRQGMRFTGERFLASYHKDKVLNELIQKHHLTTEGSIGAGDTESDIAMLKIVENPIAFNPDKQLYDFAVKNGWDIVVERKNVIYKLESSDGNYLLA